MAKAGDTYRMMPAMHDASKKDQSMQAALESWVMSHVTNGVARVHWPSIHTSSRKDRCLSGRECLVVHRLRMSAVNRLMHYAQAQQQLLLRLPGSTLVMVHGIDKREASKAAHRGRQTSDVSKVCP